MHAADIQDRDGGALVMATLFGMYPFLLKLYADGGYQGPVFRTAVTKIIARVNVEIVKRSDQAKGFAVLPRRWVVERTLAWLGRCRRLGKDWENLNRKALAFLRLATKPQVFVWPLSAAQAFERIRLWLSTPAAMMMAPGDRHLDVLESLLAPLSTAGNLTADAHLAALALEHGAAVVSCDADFERFSGVIRVNPLKA